MRAPELPGLQSLRAVAALMVLIGHVLAEANHYMALSLPVTSLPWTRGVDIFFVISGFVVTLSAHRFLGQPAAFFLRRMMRVAPLYFLFTTLMVLVLLILPTGAKDTNLDVGQIISSYFFFPFAREDGRIAPVLSLGWTLNYEMFFYALLSVCLLLSRPFLAVTAVIMTLVMLGVFLDPSTAALMFWTNPLIIEFLFGIGLARLWLLGICLPRFDLFILTGGIGFILLIILHQTDLPRFIAAGFPASLIVASATLFCPGWRMPLQSLGDASYALYLSHRFTLRAATLLILPIVPATLLGAVLYVMLVCVVASVVAVMVHLHIERPMMRALSHPLKQKLAA
jgi:peptidoglycan/LPS O-acetylase OafA/YrhL